MRLTVKFFLHEFLKYFETFYQVLGHLFLHFHVVFGNGRGLLIMSFHTSVLWTTIPVQWSPVLRKNEGVAM